MQRKLEEYALGEEELIDFNKELQWTVMMMKKDNDAIRDSLEYLMQGGDPKKLQEDELKKYLGSADPLKTPKIDNVFEVYSEFQTASPAIKQFDDGALASQVKLRTSQVPTKDNAPVEKPPSPAREGNEKVIPSTPPQKLEKIAAEIDVHELVETAKRDRKDSFQRIKEQHSDVSPVRKCPTQTHSNQAHAMAEESAVQKSEKVRRGREQEQTKHEKELDKIEGAKQKLLGKVIRNSHKRKDPPTQAFVSDETEEESGLKQRLSQLKQSAGKQVDPATKWTPSRPRVPLSSYSEAKPKSYGLFETKDLAAQYPDTVQTQVEELASSTYSLKNGISDPGIAKGLVTEFSRQTPEGQQQVLSQIERLK